VRHVNVLEKKTYETTTCECEWEVRRLPSCTDCQCADADCAECGESEILFETEVGEMPVYSEADE
jgi:hypothetical protein